jgi:hypothetical protein
MTEVLANWRAAYAPGDWIVLCGPTALVVLEPLADESSTLVNILWEEVLASSSIVDIASRLAAFGFAEIRSFGAFFWTEDGMRSLVRGAVTVRNSVSGETVADGQGIQTWSEVGLSGIGSIRIETPGARGGHGVQLPLLVGAAWASAVTLDAHPHDRVSSPQALVLPGRDLAEPSGPSPDVGGPDVGGPDVGGPDVGVDSGGLAWDIEADADLPDTEDLVPDAVAVMENADTELIRLPDSGPRTDLQHTEALPRPEHEVLARIIVSDGNTYELDQPVLIGRAPAPDEFEGSEPLLVTVLSPNQDISRTHVQVAPQDGQVVVTDLHSTNGTVLVRPGPTIERERLDPGVSVPVPVGSLLELGDGVSVLIEPSP